MNYVKIDDLKTHPDLQVRVRMNEEMIEDLAEIYRQDMDIEPVEVFELDDEVYLVDGHHRFEAAKRAGRDKLPVCILEPTSFTEAVQMAMAANSTHPTPLSRKDVRRAVELLLKYTPEISVSTICQILARSKSVIYQYIRELSDAGKLTLPKTRKGKDGKERPTKYADRERKTEDHPGRLSSLPPLQGRGIEPKSVFCGNAGCRCQCSASYLEDLKKSGSEPGDWVFGDLNPEKAYCSEECRTIAEGKVLEKEADRILENAETLESPAGPETAEEEAPEKWNDPQMYRQWLDVFKPAIKLASGIKGGRVRNLYAKNAVDALNGLVLIASKHLE